MAQTDVRQNAADYNRSLCKMKDLFHIALWEKGDGFIFLKNKSVPFFPVPLFLSVEVGQALQHQQVITDEADDFFVFDDRRVADAEIVE